MILGGVCYAYLCLWGLPWEEWWDTLHQGLFDMLGDVGRLGGAALFFGTFALGIDEALEVAIGATFGGLAALALSVGMTYSGGELLIPGFHALPCVIGIGFGGFATGFSRRV